MKKLIFYTDLDGTLLNHDNYSWSDAEDILAELKHLKIPVIFNTSKTLKEVQALQKQTEIYDPFVIENGGAVWFPENYFNGEVGRIVVLGVSIECILEDIEPLRSKYNFESYSQMSTKRISELTGLSEDAALKSSQRICSEPFIWNDSEDQLLSFHSELKKLGLNLLKGGRFYHIVGLSGKEDALKFINNKFKEQSPKEEFTSIAFGDSPNDLRMLEEADLAVVIQRPDGTYLKPENENIIYAEYQGAKGWASSADKILNDFLMRSV